VFSTKTALTQSSESDMKFCLPENHVLTELCKVYMLLPELVYCSLHISSSLSWWVQSTLFT